VLEAAPTRDGVLTLIAVTSLLTGIAALLLQVAGLLDMQFTFSAVAFPGLLVFLALTTWAQHARREQFIRRLRVGFVASLAATAAYDIVRVLIRVAAAGTIDPFRAHAVFGSLILHVPATSLAAVLVGWCYHVWNGITFGIMYVLVAGRAPVRLAIAWALFLEAWSIAVTPLLYDVSRSNLPFLATSATGHLAYGVALGLVSRRLLTPSASASVTRATA
jgi:hypothetical protein